MQKTECAELLRKVAAIDNRRIAQDVLDEWFAIIGYLPYQDALNALHKARQDDRITWLEPKHIVAHSKEDRLAKQDDDYLRQEEEQRAKAVPPPKCKHGKSLVACMPCIEENL